MEEISSKIPLYVSQDDARTVMALGAKWDDSMGSFACGIRDAARFSPWRAPSEAAELDPAVRPEPRIPRFVPAGEVHYLNVAYAERDYARELGARYDPHESSFYAPEGSDLADFPEFLDPDHALWQPHRELFVPRAERDEVRAAGAFWSEAQGSWVQPAGADGARFAKWAQPPIRQYVEVDPSRAEQAKSMGLDYDPVAKQWWQRRGRQADGLDALAAPLGRVYLNVRYEDRAAAKAAGARWDGAERKWYVPEGFDMSKVESFAGPDDRTYLNLLGRAERDAAKAAGAKYDPAERRFYFEAGKVPAEMEGLTKPVVKRYLTVPYEDRAEAKAAGAAWDPAAKSWYVRSGSDMAPFEKWTARSEQSLEAARERLKPRTDPPAPAQGFNDPIPGNAAVPAEIPEGAPWKAPAEERAFGTGAEGATAAEAPIPRKQQPVRGGADKPKPPAKAPEAPTPASDARAYKSAAQAERMAKRKAEREERKAIAAEFGR